MLDQGRINAFKRVMNVWIAVINKKKIIQKRWQWYQKAWNMES